jgi:hypothetical protein
MKHSYCTFRTEEFPGTLAFRSKPPGTDARLEYMDVRMTANTWTVKLQRRAADYGISGDLSGLVAVRNWPLAQTLLLRFGFSRGMLDECGMDANTFRAGGLEYTCHGEFAGEGLMGFEFSVRIMNPQAARGCGWHPICLKDGKDRGRASR